MWFILDEKGKKVGRGTDFPPQYKHGQRVCYQETFYTGSTLQSFADSPLVQDQQGSVHAEAILNVQITRCEWKVKVWGDSVSDVEFLLDRISKKIGIKK